MHEILLRKGFEAGWVHRIMQLVSGGQTAVSVNGEVGKYFRNKRGLRQGDPLLPLLFNFVADALTTMLEKARAAGHIKGVVDHLIPGGVTQLQYADDTMLLFEPTHHSIATVKLLLLCFEIMSGLKINFQKCGVVTLGLDAQESQRVADLLNCKLGGFPIKYLGLPISNKKLSILEWEPLYGKVASRVCPWRGRFMSSGARLILTNSSLSSLPLFTMGMFLLADGVDAKLDTPRSKFFWEGARIKRKYHLVKWAAVCRPKNQGGLGILNSKLMNVSLLTKWIWKLSQNASGLWVDLLKAKYFPNGNFFEATQ